MDNEDKLDILRIITETQADDNDMAHTGTSSVTVRIGGTTDAGMVEHDTLYVLNAPTRVTSNLQDEGYSLEMTDDGLKVEAPTNGDDE